MTQARHQGKPRRNEHAPGVQINRRELDLVRKRHLLPLNKMLHEATDRRKWSCFGGIAEALRCHRYAAVDTWFVRAKESEQLTGPMLSLAGYLRGKTAPGTLHPNRRGHQVIADRLFETIAALRTCPLGQGGR